MSGGLILVKCFHYFGWEYLQLISQSQLNYYYPVDQLEKWYSCNYTITFIIVIIIRCAGLLV